MAKPTLALIPSAYADDKVFSVLPSNGDGDFDFSRGSTGTRLNSEGLIETVTNDKPRLNYPLLDGVVQDCPSLLLEPQSTNSVQYSEAFDNAYWTKTITTITSNVDISPNGSLNADKLIPSASNNIHKIGRNVGTVTGDYTFSIFAKKGEYKNILLWDDNLSEGIGVNLDDLSVFRSVGNEGYNIENYGNGWVRISLKLNYSAQSLRYAVYIYNNSFEITFTGNGTDGLYIWGAMVEQNSYSTSYIPTTTSTVTRLAETCDGAVTSDTFNDAEGVLMAEISALANSGDGQIRIREQGVLNSVIMEFRDSGTTLRTYIFDGNATNQFFSETNINPNDNIKIALKYKQNDCSLYLNGFVTATDTTATMPSNLNSLSFNQGDGGNPFYGNTKQVQYYNSALTDSELEQLTSWVSFTDMAQGQLYTIE